ncbi:MAG: DUF1203 domain-containing protein [Myxococcaceae bacterium]
MIRFNVLPISPDVASRVRLRRRDDFGNHGLRTSVVAEPFSTPCRICLADAQVGERVLLFTYSPFDGPGPYQNAGPIFIHEETCVAYTLAKTVPDSLRRRLLSLRAYSAHHKMVGCEVVEGVELEASIERLFSNPEAAYLHAHNARPGCFACRVERGASSSTTSPGQAAGCQPAASATAAIPRTDAQKTPNRDEGLSTVRA